MTDHSPFEKPDQAAGGGGIDYRAELNSAQYEAVAATDGPVLVVAGAGSGKTRTLVYRVAYLVEQGVPPESILLLTFTRKAAGQMLDRARHLVGDRCVRVSGGTFHSLANELLRRWAGRLGYPNSFGVMDRGDMEEVLGEIRKQARMGEGDRRFPKRGTLAEIISKAANKSLPVKDLVLQDYIHLLEYLDDIVRLAQEYRSYKRENALLDFDDLLLELVRLLQEDPSARAAIAAQYRYIMVDEYQDTNLVQAEIVHLLGRDHGNVMAVGDDAQSIYSFRGASFRNIMEFPDRFPGARIIRLEENYRSYQPILNLTNHIISKARERYEKHLFSRRPDGPLPQLKAVATEKEQSLFVCRRVRELAAEGVPLSRIAVLFRAASHSFDLEVELMRHGIEFVKYGGRKFLEAAHIKDLLSLLRVTANPSDGVSLTRSLLLLDGVGPKTAAKITAWSGGQRDRLMTLQDYPGSGKTAEAIRPLAELFRDIAEKGMGLNDRLNRAWEFYRPVMESRFDDHPKRATDVMELMRLAKNYTSMVRFLTDMTLEPPNAAFSRLDMEGEGERLNLSTIHSAKGLEWKAVFIIWASEGRFPPIYALRNPLDVDEERRLMYVAATRAEDHLYVVCPLEADAWGTPAAGPQISRFLQDIPPELVTFDDDPGRRPSPPPTAQATRFRETGSASGSVRPVLPSLNGEFVPGERVSHAVFGLGRVIHRIGPNKIEIDFDHFGPKTLHLEFAGLKKTGS